MDKKGGIGRNNQLPWHLSSDLKRFKTLTMGHHLVMGRKTYESIGKSLPGRTMIVVTHQQDYPPRGCHIVNSLEDAIMFAEENGDNEVFIIGGGEIFAQAIDIADKIYLTRVLIDAKADVFFPNFDESAWEIAGYEKSTKSEKEDYDSDYRILSKIRG
jgi:dihydrofolate reductase